MDCTQHVTILNALDVFSDLIFSKLTNTIMWQVPKAFLKLGQT